MNSGVSLEKLQQKLALISLWLHKLQESIFDYLLIFRKDQVEKSIDRDLPAIGIRYCSFTRIVKIDSAIGDGLRNVFAYRI